MNLELTPQEAFDLWDANVLPPALQDRLAQMIANEGRIGHQPKHVVIEYWEPGNARSKRRETVPAAWFVQGEDRWRPHILHDTQKWRRVA